MREYIRYLEEVLGLEKIMLHCESSGMSSFYSDKGPYVPSERQFSELVFLNIVTQDNESIFIPETAALFEKMKSAMRLKNIQVLTLDCTIDDRYLLPSLWSQLCESKIVVVFSSFPQKIGELCFKGAEQWIETYSPAYLLEDPGAKKVVWNDLQKVMKVLEL